MRQVLQGEGFGIRLRPVRMKDAAFIVWLRNLEHAKGKLGDSATTVASQEAWLTSYFERNNDHYFIVETRAGIPVGTHSIYDIHGLNAEAGRFIIRPDVSAALPASIVSYDLAFGPMKLTSLRATSIASNRTLHSYIKKLGFRQVKVETGGRVIGGHPVDIFHFSLDIEDWPESRERVRPLAEFASVQVATWEQKILETESTAHEPFNRTIE